MPELHANPNINSANTWTPKALAELVEGLGGAVVATHSQSGSMGHHMARILKEHGKLHLLKGLITIEGGPAGCRACRAQRPRTSRTFPYMAFKGDYTGPSAVCQPSVADIKAVGGKADNIELDQPGFWQGKYTGPYGADYVGPFAGVSHMMMIEDNPGAGTPRKAYEHPGHGRHPGVGEARTSRRRGRPSATGTTMITTMMTMTIDDHGHH